MQRIRKIKAITAPRHKLPEPLWERLALSRVMNYGFATVNDGNGQVCGDAVGVFGGVIAEHAWRAGCV
jgi:hypothetical protein